MKSVILMDRLDLRKMEERDGKDNMKKRRNLGNLKLIFQVVKRENDLCLSRGEIKHGEQDNV